MDNQVNLMHMITSFSFCSRIPETPLRKIQEFNNFRHSTYTPTQSTEDLTKVADDTRTSSSNSPPSKTARLEDTRQLTVEINYEENNNTDITVKTGELAEQHVPSLHHGRVYSTSSICGILLSFPVAKMFGHPIILFRMLT